jgi:hypothetical protein
VTHSGTLHARQRGVALRGKGLLRLAVLLLAAADVAARGPAGFGERMTDDQPTDAVEPVGGLLLAQARLEQDRRDRLHQCERWLGDRGARAEQRDDMRMREEGGSRRARDRSEVLGPRLP